MFACIIGKNMATNRYKICGNMMIVNGFIILSYVLYLFSFISFCIFFLPSPLLSLSLSFINIFFCYYHYYIYINILVSSVCIINNILLEGTIIIIDLPGPTKGTFFPRKTKERNQYIYV